MKNIFDFPHVKSVRAWALLYKGNMAGKVVANFSDNPAGSVCTAQVMIFSGPLAPKERTNNDGPNLGKAGGYGYDKFSAAVDASFRKLGINPGDMGGRGDSCVRDFLVKSGYTVLEVC